MIMKLIVGLGNPGKVYSESRHNVGYSVVEALAKNFKIPLRKESKTFSWVGKGGIEGDEAILAMPVTFMNLSGLAVGALLKRYNLNLGSLLVVCDDLDLEFGRIKIKNSGSSGGHRGLKSIMDSIKSRDFARLRIGIGRPFRDMEPAEYVLSRFKKEEKKIYKEIIKKAVDCCSMWVKEDINKSMNVYNRQDKAN